MLRTCLFFLLAICISATPAVSAQFDVSDFLYSNRHSWLPYPFPGEATTSEVERVSGWGLDTVGLTFSAPYSKGRIDFCSLDKALEIVNDAGQKAVLFITPRFAESEQITDTLSDGRTIKHIWYTNPNYSILDIFSPRQRELFYDYVRKAVERYASKDYVCAFVIGWGYQGETGFFSGDWVTDQKESGSTCAGYSANALMEFNKWRKSHGIEAIDALPQPSTEKQSQDYIQFNRFKCDFIRKEFQGPYIKVAKNITAKPVGTFGYISALPDNYARGWTWTENADFYRTAGSASSFDLTRTLVDSGIGWEDSFLHDGNWDFSSGCMKRDIARQIARGAAHHAMYVKVYETEDMWEEGIQQKVVDFIKSSDLRDRLRPVKRDYALFIPTWSASALPSRSTDNLFMPTFSESINVAKTVGLAESFGLTYTLITEEDLLHPSRLSSYKAVIIAMSDYLDEALGSCAAKEIATMPNAICVDAGGIKTTRSEFRKKLKGMSITPPLDYQNEKIVAGRYGDLIYNWLATDVEVTIMETKKKLTLGAHEFVVASEILEDK